MGRGPAADLRRPDPGRNHRRRNPGPLRGTDLDGRTGCDQAGSAHRREPARRPASEGRRPTGSRPTGRRIAGGPMPGMPVAVALILIAAGVGAARHFVSNPIWAVAGGFVAFVMLALFILGGAQRQRDNLHEAASAEWHREFGERLQIELNRGVTDTMARHL